MVKSNRTLFIPIALVSSFAFMLSPSCKEEKSKGEAKTAASVSQAGGQSASPSVQTRASSDIDPASLSMFKSLPEAFESPQNASNPAKISLGRMLYFENRLSKNHDLSCNSCHKLDSFGVDHGQTSKGHRGQLGGRNSPTVYNAGAHVAQFWDGRAADLEAQAKGPILNPVEMAMKNEGVVVATLKSIPEYEHAFKEAFPADKDPVTYDNMAKAIGAFERKLVTPSRFDKFLKGDKTALNEKEKEGLNTFIASGCAGCHSGIAVGGGSFQKLGMVKPWPNQKDQGKYEQTKSDADKMFFKVPSLRNIEKTAPYFHDGSVQTLDEAVRLMADHQLGRKLSDAQVASIVTFLKALTGELPTEYIKPPTLPKSTDKTPKADPT